LAHYIHYVIRKVAIVPYHNSIDSMLSKRAPLSFAIVGSCAHSICPTLFPFGLHNANLRATYVSGREMNGLRWRKVHYTRSRIEPDSSALTYCQTVLLTVNVGGVRATQCLCNSIQNASVYFLSSLDNPDQGTTLI
jgi:hypothetical protein